MGKDKKKIFLISLMFFLLIFILYKKKTFEPKQSVAINVSIALINECSLIDDSFMVISIPSRKKTYFLEKKANLITNQEEKIQLIASDKFPNFSYEGIPVPVQSNVILKVDCEEPKRIKNTLDALKKQFER